MLFLSIQQELDCITDDGIIIGKIRFDEESKRHIFYVTDNDVTLTAAHQSAIEERLKGLDEGTYMIPMQDDD